MRIHPLLRHAVLLLAATGCAAPAPYVSEHIGEAVNSAKARQTINPNASQNTDPASGMDGPAATNAVGEYHNSFKAPAPTFPVINIGTGGGR
jgi:hypothetical protein